MYQFDRIAESLPEHPPRSAEAETPLGPLLVVDFSHFVAGPYASMLLADMGADVIKIEAPKGEDFRHYPPFDPQLPLQGAPYLWSNRNKRSIALDLKSEAGIRIARGLIAKADVVLENFSTGVMERLGLGYNACRAINPRLVYCSVSAYGRTGPHADRLGFDPIVQAESGFMSMNGYADREGVRSAATVMDIAAAMMACNAILAALIARERTGKGQAIEATLFDTAITMTGFAAMQHLCTGLNPRRNANTSPDTCPSGVFATKDKSFYINCGNTGIFRRLFEEVLQRPDIANDPELATSSGRLKQRERLFALLNEALSRRPWSHWQPLLRKAGVPSGEVRTLADALASNEVRDRHLVTRIPHPTVGWLPNIGLPIRFSETPVVDPRPAPAVGQHTVEILGEVLGFTNENLEQAARAGAFGASDTFKLAS